jgi:hypothetical protein
LRDVHSTLLMLLSMNNLGIGHWEDGNSHLYFCWLTVSGMFGGIAAQFKVGYGYLTFLL